MAQKMPGENYYHRTIRPDEVIKNGPTCAINRTVDSIRNSLQQLIGNPEAPAVDVHVVVTVEQLTDSAGNPLVTRGGPDNRGCW